jgi:Flp pilus assembly pilin Flp
LDNKDLDDPVIPANGTYGLLAVIKSRLNIKAIKTWGKVDVLSGRSGFYNTKDVIAWKFKEMEPVSKFLQSLCSDDSGQDIAEYAVMLAVILVIVVGTVRLIGSNASNVFSSVGSSIQ